MPLTPEQELERLRAEMDTQNQMMTDANLSFPSGTPVPSASAPAPAAAVQPPFATIQAPTPAAPTAPGVPTYAPPPPPPPAPPEFAGLPGDLADFAENWIL